jgi:phospholipase/carboxylesterase
MTLSSLTGPRRAPRSGSKAKHLVIFLHGVGSNGDDLIALVDEWAHLLPDTAFVSPNAVAPYDMSPLGFQWFSLRDYSLPAMRAGADAALAAVQGFIDAELQRYGLGDEQLALVGFSQGTMMALHAGLRRTNPCAGILGYSGALLSVDGITTKPPVCLIHGQDDMVVPFSAIGIAESLLAGTGVAVETHARPGVGHSIDGEGLRIGVEFLRKVLKV